MKFDPYCGPRKSCIRNYYVILLCSESIILPEKIYFAPRRRETLGGGVPLSFVLFSAFIEFFIVQLLWVLCQAFHYGLCSICLQINVVYYMVRIWYISFYRDKPRSDGFLNSFLLATNLHIIYCKLNHLSTHYQWPSVGIIHVGNT